MFDLSANDTATILENTQVNMFRDPEANAAADRCNKITAAIIRSGDSNKFEALTKDIFFMTDAIIIGEATVDLMENDEVFRAFIIQRGGVELLGQSINMKRAELTAARDALVALKKNLS